MTTQPDAEFPHPDPLHEMPQGMKDAFMMASAFMPDRVTLVERLYTAYINKELPTKGHPAMAELDSIMLQRAEIMATQISGMPIFHCWKCLQAKIFSVLMRYNVSLETPEQKAAVVQAIIEAMMEAPGERAYAHE